MVLRYSDVLPLYHVLCEYRRSIIGIKCSNDTFLVGNFHIANYCPPFFPRQRKPSEDMGPIEKMVKDLEAQLDD